MSAADTAPAWAAWTSVLPVVAAPASRERYLRVPLPSRMPQDADGGYPDLRIIDDRNAEVPYALDPVRAPDATRHVDLIDTGFVPHQGSQAVLDLGSHGDLVDTIRLDVSYNAPATFFENVVVDASDDRMHWRLGTSPTIVYRVARDGASNLTLDLPPTRSRWLRVRVLDPHTVLALSGAEMTRSQGSSQHLVALATPDVRVTTASRTQSWTFAFAQPVRPAAAHFSAPNVSFSRQATVDESDDGTTWSQSGDGTIAHFSDGGSNLTIWITPRTARYWRVTVRNENDAPVAFLRPALLAVEHDAVFAAAPNRSYRVIFGNASAAAPAYDLGVRLAHGDWSARAATLRPVVANASYRDPRPLFERFPWLLSTGLVIIAALLGGLALRTIRSTTIA